MLRASIVKLSIRFGSLIIFVSFLEHREDEDKCKRTDHGRGLFRTKWHNCQNRDHQEIDVCGSLKLIKEG